MLDYRSRHFGERRPGPEWSTLRLARKGSTYSREPYALDAMSPGSRRPENHIARLGGYSERAAKRAAAAVT